MSSNPLSPHDFDEMLVYRLNSRGLRKFRHDSMIKAHKIFDIIRPFYDHKECPSRLLRDCLDSSQEWLTNGKCTSILHDITGIWLDLKKMGTTSVISKSRATIWILILLGRATGFWTSSSILYLNSDAYQIRLTMTTIEECRKSVLTLLAIRRFRRAEMGILGMLDYSTMRHIAAVLWTSRFEFVWISN